MPKTDLVPTYWPGFSQKGEPNEIQTRETLRLWKKEGKGYFCDNGRKFQLAAAPEPSWEDVLKKYGVRGQSVKIDEPSTAKLGMMSRYVIGETYAVEAVNSWA